MNDAMPVLLMFTNVTAWRAGEAAGPALSLHSPIIRTREPWNELVLSWNIEPADGAAVEIEVEPLAPGAGSYHMGAWSLDERAGLARTSVKGQRDAGGRVQTDTLVLAGEAREFSLRVRLRGTVAQDPRRLRCIAVSLSDTRRRPEPRAPNRAVWGRSMAVPERSQIAQPGGEAWCSPTSVSMVLAYWSVRLDQPGWDRSVLEVVDGVNDPGWGGTGNWSFNMAYAGSLPGLRAVAGRLRDLRDVEDLIAADIPVVLSVNAPALRGKPLAPDGGHLVICTGFTEEGDLVVNDPYARLTEGQRVRRVYRRENVERAWDHAHRLAYLVAPLDRVKHFPGRIL